MTGGPARYFDVKETGGRLGFITPLTHNFCESCNRVRVTCTGTLYMCLGQEDAADLREPLRRSETDEPLVAAIRAAIARKPKGHDFVIARAALTGDATAHERHRRLERGKEPPRHVLQLPFASLLASACFRLASPIVTFQWVACGNPTNLFPSRRPRREPSGGGRSFATRHCVRKHSSKAGARLRWDATGAGQISFSPRRPSRSGPPGCRQILKG